MLIHSDTTIHAAGVSMKPDTSPAMIIEQPLTDAARAARDQAILSLIEPAERRTVSSFLGRDDYQDVAEVIPLPMAHLMLECLPAMMRENGGQVVWSLKPEYHSQMVHAILRTVHVNGHPHSMLHEGYLFLYQPDELVVVSAEPDKWEINVCVRSSVSSTAFIARWKRFAREHNYLRGQAFFADGTVIERGHRYGWDDILLPEQTRQTLRRYVDNFLNNRHRLRAMGAKLRRGLLLSGPPGTGKTLLGKVLSNTLDCSFLWITPRYVRNAESFQQIMSLARFVAPVVVFMEDLDLFAEERDSDKWTGLGELMNQLDGAVDNEEIITIATTNRVEVIEAALRNRPGRFDRIVEFAGMDEPCRRRLLSRLLGVASIQPDDLEHLVASTDSYTGAQVEEVANTLLIMSLDAGSCPPDKQDRAPAVISRKMVNAALGEVRCERKSQMGFHGG